MINGKMLTTIDISNGKGPGGPLSKEELMMYEKLNNTQTLNGGNSNKHSNRKRPQTGSLNVRMPSNSSAKDGSNSLPIQQPMLN
jgi:hypothetical protein